MKGRRVVQGCYECGFMFFAEELQTSRVYVPSQNQSLFDSSYLKICVREIAFDDENGFL